MKVAIVYGNNRKGSTYHCVEVVKNSLLEYGEVSFQEIFLPKDLSELCLGCFNCIIRGETLCPHSKQVSPIITSLIEADGIIMASPVYGLDVSGAMKTLIDHLCFMWIPHRPHPEMFSKVGFVISTAAGTGTSRTNKTMKKALDYMGVKKTYQFGVSVAASSWEDINKDKKRKIEKKLIKKARKFYHTTQNRNNLRSRLFTKLMFTMIKRMIKNYEDTNVDKQYWSNHGWLEKTKPY
ncbi:flavodoxin family protein [Alkaliphilus transvaalensis]|uniref:flavodoxin family protein n=1 Tax=Alkaliphilus transvaalensis TaxID=114628 RepID=UPI00047886F5|nr:NAD(P)H-dependent oxidoreductase [Alkaliphilus transvaalensis]